MKDKNKVILSVLGILMLIVVTVGVTFAVFTYTKLGTTENTVTTGTLKFLYTENTGVGAGINIDNAFPVSDTIGKSYDTDKYVFDFSVEATNSGTSEIPYEVTLRKKSTSTLANDNVKVYLTDMTGEADTEIVEPTLYSDLIQTTIDVGEEVEKTIYKEAVLAGELTYLKDFRLRMWIDEASNQDDINGKTFTALVNVYSNVPLVSEEELASRSDTEITSITIGNKTATKTENQDYDYSISLPEGTTSTTINIETTDPNSEVKIEKLDSLTYNNSTIKKVSSTRTLNLTSGNNYFKITVVSENKKNTQEYTLWIKLIKKGQLEGFAKKIYDANSIIESEPTTNTSSNNTSDVSGLYVSIDTNDGMPTYYFRGNVENNYVDFAGFTWRIVRINEDGTIRLIMSEGINDSAVYKYNYDNAVALLDEWYNEKLINNSYILSGKYCTEFHSKYKSSTSGGVIYQEYNPSFKCNETSYHTGKIGLITYDEAVFSGLFFDKANKNNYLYNEISHWTLSSAGNNVYWAVYSDGSLSARDSGGFAYGLVPVINITPNIVVTGTGESDNHYVIE